jgi:CubicO group peptidase (beta-lactamase class C family)
MNKVFVNLILFLVFSSNYAYTDENMIEDYIIKALEFWNVPGASIAVVKDNKIILAKGFGYTKLKKTKNNEVDAETLFPIASLTKSFSAVATGIFAAQRQINLDATIQSLWPSFKLSDGYATNHLTLRDCLSMRAGLTGYTFENSWWGQSYLTEKMLIEDLSKLSFPYGFRGCFAYQNLLYNIASHIIETNTGKSWDYFIKENLLDKLTMHLTTTNHAAFLAIQNKAFPHQWKENNIAEVPFEKLDMIAAGAGLASNANDMVKWLKFVLDKNSPYGAIIKDTLTPQTLLNTEMFFSKEEAWMEKVFFPKSHFLTYGMGWFIHDYKDILICQDPGLTDGMNGLMAVIPELNLGIVILNNLETPFFSHSVLFYIIDYYRKEITDWNQALLNIRKL